VTELTQVKTVKVLADFEIEHARESSKTVVPSSNIAIDDVLLMDLDAYNYISAFLFEGMGTEEENVQALSLSEKQVAFRKELLRSCSSLPRSAII
jgi:hypothetical protein